MTPSVRCENVEIVQADFIDNILQTRRVLVTAMKQNKRPHAATRLSGPVAIKEPRPVGALEAIFPGRARKGSLVNQVVRQIVHSIHLTLLSRSHACFTFALAPKHRSENDGIT